MRAVLAIAVLVLAPALAAGEGIYQSTDDQGNPLFTDEPPSNGAEPVKLKPLTTVPAAEAPPIRGKPRQDAKTGDPQAMGYTDLEVIYPPAGQAVRHNGGMVPFRVALEPEGKELEDGHRVEILLDGAVGGSGAHTQVSVSPVHRGSHTVRARVVDASGTPVVSSAPVDFHLLRHSIIN